jgi:hypothetical protein
MLPSRKAKAKKPSVKRAFASLQKSYGLRTVDQIKSRIIWAHLAQIVVSLFGDSARNRRLKNEYEHQWRILEAEERRIISNSSTSAIRRSH